MTTDDADLDYWLRRWASYMRWNAMEGGYPSVASGFDNAVTNFAVAETDSDDYWSSHVVPSILQAVDAAIDSLEPEQRRAIWWRYGLTKIEPSGPTAFGEAFSAVKVLVLARVAIAA